MNSLDDPNEIKNRLVQIWHEFGERFGLFVPEEQPAPTAWDTPVPEPDEKGVLDPQALKHWRQLFPTKDFLRSRYGKFRILEGPSLYFDCLVPKFHTRIFDRWGVDEHGNPDPYPVNDTHEWYDKAIRMGIWGSEVEFSCRSRLCERTWCLLHRTNPTRINPVDIYSLVAEFEGISLTKAKTEVGKWFGVKLGALKSRGIRDTRKPRRRVSKQAIFDVLARYRTVRSQHVDSLIRELSTLIKRSHFVPWHGRMFDDEFTFLSDKVVDNLYRIKSPAVKAYLWLLVRQEDEARNTRGNELEIADADLATALGVTRKTAGRYMLDLQALGLVKLEERTTGRKKEIIVKLVKY